jgi:aminoglycoside/choline kinase family phosphotransferase
MTRQILKQHVSTGTTGDLSERKVRDYAASFFDCKPEQIALAGLTPDASTRKYFRIAATRNLAETLIVSLYPAPFSPHDNSFLDVTRLFERAQLPVPKILDVADTAGIILQEDLGDTSLAKWLTEASAKGDQTGADEMSRRAIELIARIQAASTLADETGSVASRLAFDEDKLGWELNFFFDHFFGSYRKQTLPPAEEEAIKTELQTIAAELSARPRVLTHRDYHAMNLMVDRRGELRVIDHQDARMGPATYDLVPLLVERRLEPADEAWVEEWQGCFLREREKLGLPKIETAELRYEFNLMTVQRQLKAIGTFSYQTGVAGRGEFYEKYIVPAIATVLRAMRAPGMREYPALRAALENLTVEQEVGDLLKRLPPEQKWQVLELARALATQSE